MGGRITINYRSARAASLQLLIWQSSYLWTQFDRILKMVGDGHGRHLHKEAIEFLKREHLFPGHGRYSATSAAIGIEPLICGSVNLERYPSQWKRFQQHECGGTFVRSLICQIHCKIEFIGIEMATRITVSWKVRHLHDFIYHIIPRRLIYHNYTWSHLSV